MPFPACRICSYPITMIGHDSAMGISPQELVREIHDAPMQLVLALNGGSRALAEMLEMPGGSRALLEATVPYSEKALVAWLGSRPEQFCSARTAVRNGGRRFRPARSATARRRLPRPASPAAPAWPAIGPSAGRIAPM